jgi:drug/metabolite transporter (DMT)-like permease
VSQTTPATSRNHVVAAHLALVGAQVAFGLFPIVGTLLFAPGGLSPLAVGAWRIAGGAIVLATVAWIAQGRMILPGRTDLFRFAAAACLGVWLNQGLYLEGLARSTPINAVLVMCLIPVFTFALAAAFSLEQFSPLRLAGVLVALAGTLPLLLGRGFTLGRYGLGNLLMVSNALSYSGYLVVSKPLTQRYPPLVVIAWTYLLALPFVPFFAWGEPLTPAPGHHGVWWALAFTIAFPTVLAYIFNVFALAWVPASTTAIYIYAQPLITGLASWVVFSETPTRPMLLAAPALFAGIWLVSRPRPRNQLQRAAA